MIQVREHLSERFTRARLRLELSRSVRPAVVLAIGAVIAVVCFGYIASNVARSLYMPMQTIRFEVDSARAVQSGVQEVKVKGIAAGTITDVKLVGGQPVITAQFEEKYGPIYRDARATLRPETALEDMFLDIVDRGTRAAGEVDPEEPLPASQTQTAVNVAEVLQTFDADTRVRLAGLLRDLGGGLEGRGDDLRASFVRVVPFLEVAARMSGQLSKRDVMTRRLVSNTSKVARELARRQHELRTLATEGAATLGELAAGSADLEATIAELPPTLTGIDTSFRAVRGVLGDVDEALVALGPVAGRLPDGLQSLRELSATGGPAVRRLRQPVRRLVPFADALVPLSQEMSTAVGALRPQTSTFDHVTESATGCLDAIERFFQWTPSVMKTGDARGVSPRAFVTFGLESASLATDPNVFAGDSCAPGSPIGGVPGPAGGGR